MSHEPALQNQVRAFRQARGWSQDELAERCGISRAAVSAIEIRRLVPSTAAALALAAAFDCRVEDLFQLSGRTERGPEWAWPPATVPCRYWRASVAGRTWLYPVEATSLGLVPHDGVYASGDPPPAVDDAAEQTLVMASCDPAVGLLAAELRKQGVRLLVLPRSSRNALDLLKRKLVHAAGVHLGRVGEGNAAAVTELLGGGYRLLRSARWQEGLAASSQSGLRSVRAALQADVRWIGREPGSGARQCLDELLSDRRAPRRMAFDHRGVAEAIRCDLADVGVCLRLTSEEAGLKFFPIRDESYDLCYAADGEHDPRLQALRTVLRSASYRQSIGELPGYDSSETGTVQTV